MIRYGKTKYYLFANNITDLLVFRIKLIPKGCCCQNCLPKTWRIINKRIFPHGPVWNNENAVITYNDHKISLECIESGPVITMPIDTIKEDLGFINLIINAIFEGIERDKRKTKYIDLIIQKAIDNHNVKEKVVLRITKYSSEISKKLKEKLSNEQYIINIRNTYSLPNE